MAMHTAMTTVQAVCTVVVDNKSMAIGLCNGGAMR